jgi:hypothetical protein
MDNTIDALKNLYVAMGGNEDDVADLSITPDMINAIAAIQGQGGKKQYQHNIYIFGAGKNIGCRIGFSIINDQPSDMDEASINQYLVDNDFHQDLETGAIKLLPASGGTDNASGVKGSVVGLSTVENLTVIWYLEETFTSAYLQSYTTALEITDTVVEL